VWSNQLLLTIRMFELILSMNYTKETSAWCRRYPRAACIVLSAFNDS
jgi:hypothetical protein